MGNSGRTIPLPIHVNENIQKMKKATRELKEIKVRDPTEDELADRLGWSVASSADEGMAADRVYGRDHRQEGDPWEDADDAVAEAASLNAATQSWTGTGSTRRRTRPRLTWMPICWNVEEVFRPSPARLSSSDTGLPPLPRRRPWKEATGLRLHAPRF